jgi:hypothetical protein
MSRSNPNEMPKRAEPSRTVPVDVEPNAKRTTQIMVALRNADPTALTALASLRRYLGFGDNLLDLRRRVLWELCGPDDEIAELILDALRRGGELWNPNKERGHIRPPGSPIELLGSPLPDGGRWESWLAWDPSRDLDCRVRALSPWRAQGWRIRRGTLWSLNWAPDDAAERRRLAERAVITHGAHDGLLVHPHLEDARRIASDDPVPWLPQRGQED